MIGTIVFILFLSCILIKLETTSAQGNLVSSRKKEINYRLPTSVEPINYKIELTTYLDVNSEKNFTFDGIATIFLEVKEDTNNITIHTNGLKFDEKDVCIRDEKDKEINPLLITYEGVTNFTIIKAENKFTKGTKYSLWFKSFSGSLMNDDFRGFYRSSYKNETGQKV